MRWRRAIAAVCALNLLYTAAEFLVDTEQGLLAAIVIALPLSLVAGLAGWWAWRGWSVRPAPPMAVALLWAMGGSALAFGVLFAVVRLLSGGQSDPAGLSGLAAAPLGGLFAGAVGFVRQRRRLSEGQLARG